MTTKNTHPFHKRYRLTLEFDVSLTPDQIEEDEQTDEEMRLKLRSEQHLIQMLLKEQPQVLADLAQRTLIDTVFLLDEQKLMTPLLPPGTCPLGALLSPATNVLPAEEKRYFQEAQEQGTFEEAISDILQSVLITLDAVGLHEVFDWEADEA